MLNRAGNTDERSIRSVSAISEGTAEWSATGPENQGKVKLRGSIPLSSAIFLSKQFWPHLSQSFLAAVNEGGFQGLPHVQRLEVAIVNRFPNNQAKRGKLDGTITGNRNLVVFGQSLLRGFGI